jgi:hypothetical protein
MIAPGLVVITVAGPARGLCCPAIATSSASAME